MKTIPVTNSPIPAIVDDADYPRVIGKTWCLTHGYPGTNMEINGRKRMVVMHRFILDAKTGTAYDHVNRNKLDNQRENLRPANQSQNMANSEFSGRKTSRSRSRYKGVSWCKQTKRWRATMGFKGRYMHLGRFDDETEAAMAYNEAATKAFGVFACLNPI
jgi:hypothetical protein